jgi:hypothetical protein
MTRILQMTNSKGISLEDKKSIIGLMKILHARTKAGEEDICVKCYVQKVLFILDKYDGLVHTNSKREN